MTLKKALIILFLIFSLVPTYKVFAQASSAGFVPGSIWYSIDPFAEGDKIKIYTFIFNGDKRELSGTVVFFDKDTLLGKRNFVVPSQAAEDIYVDWTATIGTHSIFAKIENAKFLISKGKYEEARLAQNQTPESLRTVNKKIIPKAVDTTSSANSETSDSSFKALENIGNIIEENTPNFIAKPVLSAVNTAENFRSKVGLATENKKEEVQNQIKVLGETKTISGEKGSSTLLKPFKYVELFFFTLLSFLFNYKIVFYLTLIIIFFFILRYIWHRIF